MSQTEREIENTMKDMEEENKKYPSDLFVSKDNSSIAV